MKYKVLGINDDQSFCSCCGKEGLKRVVWMAPIHPEDGDLGEPEHYGTSCAARILGYSNLTPARARNKVEELAIKGRQEEHHQLRSLGALISRISPDIQTANMKFWKAMGPGATDHRHFLMGKDGKFVRVLADGKFYQRFLHRMGFRAVPGTAAGG